MCNKYWQNIWLYCIFICVSYSKNIIEKINVWIYTLINLIERKKSSEPWLSCWERCMNLEKFNQVSPWVWRIVYHFLIPELMLKNPTLSISRQKLNNTGNWHIFIFHQCLKVELNSGIVLPKLLLDIHLTRRHPGSPYIAICCIDQNDCYPDPDISTNPWVGLLPLVRKASG